MAGEEFLIKRDAVCQCSFRGGPLACLTEEWLWRCHLGPPPWRRPWAALAGSSSDIQALTRLAARSALYPPDIIAVISQFTEKNLEGTHSFFHPFNKYSLGIYLMLHTVRGNLHMFRYVSKTLVLQILLSVSHHKMD